LNMNVVSDELSGVVSLVFVFVYPLYPFVMTVAWTSHALPCRTLRFYVVFGYISLS